MAGLVAVALALLVGAGAPQAHGRAAKAGPVASVWPSCRDATTPATQLSAARRQAALRCAIVRVRRTAGLGSLARLRPLDRVATAHTADMVRKRYFDHKSPSGEHVRDRLTRARLRPKIAGETLAWACNGRLTPSDAVRGWMASPPHRRVLLNPRYAHVGAGALLGSPEKTCPDGVTWTAVFARF